jgi:RNA polymerase sigma-70 factor (ECF subfamily)
MSTHSTPHLDDPRPSFSGLRRSERELVLGLRAGRVEAFETLDREYRDRVRRFAWKRLRDRAEAEDVCQDVFLDIHRSISSFEGRSSFTTWLFGIAHHQVHRRFRRKGRDMISLEADGVGEPSVGRPRMEDRIDAARALERLDRALERSVAPRHREIFHLRYGDGRATRDIAETIGRSNQSVKISLFRTRRALEAASPVLGELLAAS